MLRSFVLAAAAALFLAPAPDDAYTIKVKDAGPLVKEFSSERETREGREKAFRRKKPVNVDDTWDIDMKPLLKVFNKDDAMVVDADKAKGTATLVKAYKKDDKQFGIIKLSMSLPVKSVGKGNEKIVAAANSIFSMDMELDGCIDGSSGAGIFKGGFKLDLKGSMQHPQAGQLDVSSSVESKSEEAQTELPKK